jgi:hypothetical protein
MVIRDGREKGVHAGCGGMWRTVLAASFVHGKVEFIRVLVPGFLV